MRYSSFLIIIFILGVCNYGFPNLSPVISPSVEVEQIPTSTASVRFAGSTSTPPVSNLSEEGNAESLKAADRAIEDGLPLAARVNNQPIFLETYEKRVTQFEKELETQGVDLASDDGPAILRQIRKQVLDGLFEQLIIEQQARNLGIIITKEEVEARAKENIAQLPDQAQFEEWLVNNDLTYQEFLVELQTQLVANEVFETITQSVPEAANQIQLRYIRVEAEVTAQTIIEELKTGTNFATLAQQYSLAKGTEANPDWFPKGSGLLPDEVETIAFSLQPGEVSGPIQTSRGYYIIKLENKEADRPVTSEMLQILKKQIFDEWLIELRSSAAIEVYIEL